MRLVDYTPRRTALVLIDLMPRVIALPTQPHPGTEVLERCLALASALRACGGLVVWVRVERPDVEEQPPGSELAPECDPQPGDVRIVKRSWGAFGHTDLDDELRSRGIDTVALGGIATNFGVESTARGAADLGYQVISIVDAMAGLHAHAHTFAVDYVLPRLGDVCTTEEFLATLD